MKQTLCSTGQVSSDYNFLPKQPSQPSQTITQNDNFPIPQPTTLQTTLRTIQQNVIMKQLSLYRSLSHQKSLPGLIIQFNTKSQQLIKLQAVYSKEGQVRQSDMVKGQGQKVGLEGEVEELEGVKFNRERELVKVGYEKELWGREVDGLEERMGVELGKERELKEERVQLERVKSELLAMIEEEKRNIEKCSIRKAEIIYQIQELQQIELNPIHLIKQQNLQFFKHLSELLYEKSSEQQNQQNTSSSLTIHQLSIQLANLSRKEYESQTCGSYEEQISQLIRLLTKTKQLENELNQFSFMVIGKSQQISIEQLKGNILTKQIQERQQELLKLNQLLAIAHHQPFIVSTEQQNPFTTDIPHLQGIIEGQQQQNLRLKERLRQLMTKLQTQHQTYDQLNKLRLKAKQQRQEEIKVMLQKNVELFNSIDKKQNLCEKKMAGDKGMQKGIQIAKKNQDDYLLAGKTNATGSELPLQQLCQKPQNPLFIQITNQNLTNNNNKSTPKQKPLTKPQPKPQPLEQKLKQLRQRLTAKFQAQTRLKN